ncbi:hypothetical protein RB195_012716 [Necator americanus]|uniref:Uncharacterized protein n=1 Tax=Necator americanus TaxID=51031 RepID=A0ABR1DS77_NECAM
MTHDMAPRDSNPRHIHIVKAHSCVELLAQQLFTSDRLVRSAMKTAVHARMRNVFVFAGFYVISNGDIWSPGIYVGRTDDDDENKKFLALKLFSTLNHKTGSSGSGRDFLAISGGDSLLLKLND